MYPDLILHTNGKGLYTKKVAAIRIESIEFLFSNIKEGWGELRVYFNTDDWDVQKDDVIYTDPMFQYELQEHLPYLDFGYSEHGMQGKDYVSFDGDIRK